MKVTKDGAWTKIELDGRVDQLELALALTKALNQGATERYDEMKDPVVALETAIIHAVPDKEVEILQEAERLDREYYRQDRLDFYESQWENIPPSLAAMTMPG
jgi:hypothetical protein